MYLCLNLFNGGQTKRLLLIIAILGFSPTAAAQGGPPLITDDTGTPGDGKWENNFAVVVSSAPDQKVVRAPSVDLNYGFGEHIQLNYQVGVIQRIAPSLARDPGLTQQVIGAKWRFLDSAKEDDGLSLSTYPKIGWHGPGSSPNPDLTPNEVQSELPIELRLGLGATAVTTELGRAFLKAVPDSWFYGAAAALSPTKGLTLNFEVHGECDASRKESEWLLNLGSHVEVSEAVDVIVAVGRFVKVLGPGPQGTAYAGVTLHQ